MLHAALIVSFFAKLQHRIKPSAHMLPKSTGRNNSLIAGENTLKKGTLGFFQR